MQTVIWAASGSEAVQKAIWACLHRDESRDIILATRYGFHGKKGLAGAVTGCETDHDRDPRVKFIAFPMAECDDASKYGAPFDPAPYVNELETLSAEYGDRLNCLITEPYLGGGGSYHPPVEYLQLLQRFCRAHDVAFILDEVQANFGRCGRMYAFETYGIEPDFVTLGKGLGNGVPVSAVVGRADFIASLKYGEASDTWSGNPIGCAAVLATLDEFETNPILEHTRSLTAAFFEGLNRLKETGLIAKVRGEREGLVYGIECALRGNLTANEVAVKIVEAAYLGLGDDGIHLLGAGRQGVAHQSTVDDQPRRGESVTRSALRHLHQAGRAVAAVACCLSVTACRPTSAAIRGQSPSGRVVLAGRFARLCRPTALRRVIGRCGDRRSRRHSSHAGVAVGQSAAGRSCVATLGPLRESWTSANCFQLELREFVRGFMCSFPERIQRKFRARERERRPESAVEPTRSQTRSAYTHVRVSNARRMAWEQHQ